MLRNFIALLLTITLASAAFAQDAATPTDDTRAATGGAPTLADIMARQNGEQVPNATRELLTGDPLNAANVANQLGTLGGASDSEVYRALRFGTADVTVSTQQPAAGVLIQDRGMAWLQFRQGPLLTWGGYGMLGMLGLLALFYLVRGRIRIDGEKTGNKILRFTSVERFGHWLFAGSFILLGITGLVSLFGRVALIPLFGKESFAWLAMVSKWVHNNVAWAFMVGLVMITVMWLVHNIPNRHDLKWLAVGGGLFSKDVHPPARKFNAGQKMIFWSCVVLGVSISASGLSLLFPFELPMFAKTFAILNDTGIPALLGLGTLPEVMAPHEEMQFAQAWHAIVAFVFMIIIIAHIYLGSVGMEGAFDAMGTGEVEEQWAREHHGLWVEEMEAKERAGSGAATPAE
ncbi:MAG: formate dehydrogenase subunit gamma [Pseudomonadota bacterium]